MAKEDLSKKPVVKTVAPVETPGRDRTMEVKVSFKIDRALKLKLPFLAISLVLFLFACIMLAKANFSFGDIFDFNRIANNLEKLYSLSFILFVVLLSFAIAMAALFGFKLNTKTVLMYLAAFLVPFAIAYVISPKYTLAYLALVFPVGLTAFFISMQEKLNLSSIYSAVSKALLLFMVLAVAFTFLKVQSDKDVYFDAFMFNVAKLSPQLQGQLQSSVADAIETIEINGTQLSAALAGAGSSSGSSNEPIALISKDTAAAIVAQNYDAFRRIMVNSFTDAAERDYADTKMPKYSALTAAQREAVVNDVYAQLNSATAPAPTGSSSGSGDAFSGVWPKLRSALAEQVRSAPAKQVSQGEIPALKAQLMKLPLFQTFYNNFEFFMALIVLSLLSLLVWVIKALATLFTVGIAKLIP